MFKLSVNALKNWGPIGDQLEYVSDNLLILQCLLYKNGGGKERQLKSNCYDYPLLQSTCAYYLVLSVPYALSIQREVIC